MENNDFYKIVVQKSKYPRDGYDYLVKPKFNLLNSKDIVVKQGKIYAFWINDKWYLNQYSLYRKIDSDINKKIKELINKDNSIEVIGKYLNDSDSGELIKLKKNISVMEESEIDFNKKVLFSDHEIIREDYATFTLTYKPEKGSTEYFHKMFDLLYDKEELDKILWIIGAVATGEISNIQKMLYLFGEKQSGKGTIIDLIMKMFEGYYGEINLGDLIGNDSHATTQVKNIPILIDPDSNISSGRNTVNLLKVVSHEPLVINPKGKDRYSVTFKGVLITASNNIIKMPNINDGMVRRPLVVKPTGKRHDIRTYRNLVSKIDFEYSAIIYECIEKFNEMGIGYYDKDNNIEMLGYSDIIHSFVEEFYEIIHKGITLKSAAELYKSYLEDYGFNIVGYKKDIKIGLNRYFKTMEASKKIDGVVVRNYFESFDETKLGKKVKEEVEVKEKQDEYIYNNSTFDVVAKDYPAQYCKDDGTPLDKWVNVKTTLSDIDTSKLHYVMIPNNHIIIDFDLKDKNGEKSLELNKEASNKFPDTYGEISRSGNGIHLHYIYNGKDLHKLATKYEDGIEIKVYNGNAALRRKVTYTNGKNIISISSGLPFKEAKEEMYIYTLNDLVMSEATLRKMIKKNIKKEYHSDTTSSINYIKWLIDEAVKQDIMFDINDMKQDILVFALGSTNQSANCLKVYNNMVFENNKKINNLESIKDQNTKIYKDEDLVFFDIEVFPNIYIVCWKKYGDKMINKWVNPTKNQIEQLIEFPIVGFNNREYDNHILYGILLGESIKEIYNRSMNIINTGKGKNYAASNISYADIYDYSSNKQSLKKWQLEMGVIHDEVEYDWNKPLEEKDINRVIDYCCNDVLSTEELFKFRYSDYKARCILSEISGMPVNETTQHQAAKFLFGDEQRPQDKFIYTDLSKEFPGYKFEYGKSSYKGEDPSEGGYVYAETGYYENVALLDVESLHPNSLVEMDYFGPYTSRYKELLDARLAIKHNNLELAKTFFNGLLTPYLKNEKELKPLSTALKIIINIVYGLTSASFDNKFRQPDNVDNIVAKRGALFMIDLKNAVIEKGYKVIHVKTDSIKIPNADDKIIKFVKDFGKKYGYTFELESIYSKICLINNAVYIAKEHEPLCGDKMEYSEDYVWNATGARFAEPFIYKSFFTKEKIVEKDFCIIKKVSGNGKMYLGNEFVGKNNYFYASVTGDVVKRIDSVADKEGYVSGTKGYLWELYSRYKGYKDIDMNYYIDQGIKAGKEIEKFIELKTLISEENIPDWYKK